MTSSPIETPNFPLPLFMHMTVFIRNELYSCVYNLLQSSLNADCHVKPKFWPEFICFLRSSAMHGLIHVIFRGFVVDKFGESAWKEILKIAGTLTEFLWWLEKRRLVHSVSFFFVGKFVFAKNCFLRFLLAHVVDLFVLQVLKQVRH